MTSAVLSSATLFESSGDPDWRTLLASAARFEAFLDTESPKTPARLADAERHRLALLEAAEALRQRRPPLAITRQHERWFTEAVLVWLAYRETASAPLIDTVGTDTAYRFALDLPDSEAVESRVEAALHTAFGWTPDELGEMKRRLEFLSSNLRLKHAIIDAITQRLGTDPSAAEVHAFAKDVFGSLATRDGDFDLVVTQTAFFLCIPFDDAGPKISDLADRPAEEQAAVRGLIQGINKAAMSLKHVRFPAFGFFEPDCVSPTLLDAIEAHLKSQGMEVPRSVMAETLATMVTILPTQKVDMYLVHDLWGHGWQESLCEFEWIFERLVANAHTMSPFDGAETVPALTAGFSTSSTGTILDSARFAEAVDDDLRARIEIGINGVMAECLADLSEYKFIVEEDPEGHLMPTSSLLRGAAVKLDFTLQDTQINQKSWSRPYRVLLRKASAQAELRRDLQRQGLPEPGLDAALDEAAELLKARFGPAFVKGLALAEDDDGTLVVSVAQKVFVAMSLLAASIEEFADARRESRETRGPQWESPTTSIDLLMLALGWYFEQDRRRNIWEMDRLLDHVIRPLAGRLEAALGAAP